MDRRPAHDYHDGWHRTSCQLLARLAAVALLVAFGLGTPDVFAQQSQQAPTLEAPSPPAGAAAAPRDVDLTDRKVQDWVLRCGRPNQQGPEVCEMQQQTTDKEGRTVMAVAVGQVPGTSDLGLLIVLPLGILLPAGVMLQIDGGAQIPLQVDRCERQGCRIEQLLQPDLVSQLKAGTKATVFFEAFDPQGERQRLGVPISLLGFTAALNEVTS
jgi:invasion protein IalB